MLVAEILFGIVDVISSAFSVYLIIVYLDIFFGRKKLSGVRRGVYLLFFMWQLIISSYNRLPGYINICITIGATLLISIVAYNGKLWNKCIFVLAFNAIWMMTETLCGYVFMNHFDDYLTPKELGSVISKMLLLLIILALRKVFTDDEVKELPMNYSIMLVLIPIGSIYIVNNLFMLSSGTVVKNANIRSLVASVILLFINILVFYIYLKLTDEIQLKRSNAVYEQQLELYERHQQERELSMLQMRDVKHNMKNNLISILAYAENGDCAKVMNYIEEIMEEGALNFSSISDTGNVVIDSLVNYWSARARRIDIEFSVELNIPMQMPFRAADLCLILGNALENAVEAARSSENKYIKLHIKYDKNNLLIYVLNSFNGCVRKTKDGKYKSTKKNAGVHGVGLESIYRAAQKYHGTVLAENSDKEFLLKVLLYCPSEFHKNKTY